jgi:predicted Zn-dependent protease
MKDRRPFFAACCFAATALSLLLTGCDSSESRARQALADYQAASAAGDLRAARIALLQLVSAEDDNSSNWQELGKVHIQLGSYNDAYYAFTRAHELDKSNPQVLSSLTQLSLLSGNMDVAEEYAQKLELLVPQHPAVKLTYGYVALRRADYDRADQQADQLLAEFPREPSANLLKARILLGRGESEAAVKLLETQTQGMPTDTGAWKALIALYERNRNWPGVTLAASKLASLNPKDTKTAFKAIDAAFRANNIEHGLRLSEPFLGQDSPPNEVDSVLTIWAERWRTPKAVQHVRDLSRSASRSQALAYATYFNSVGQPHDAAALLGGGAPRLPVTKMNLSFNAVIAESLARKGELSQAKTLFDQILAIEPDHVYALRGRANLEIRMGSSKAAVIDGQRLVSVVPQSARDRLLLARAYAAAGDKRQVDRTLWEAFHAITADLTLYETLRTHVERFGGPEAVARVDAEFQQQQDTDLSRDFI